MIDFGYSSNEVKEMTSKEMNDCVVHLAEVKNQKRTEDIQKMAMGYAIAKDKKAYTKFKTDTRKQEKEHKRYLLENG